MPQVTFGQFAPAIEKRIKALENRYESLANKVASMEITLAACNATLTELKASFDEQLTELFTSMEAAREMLDELMGIEDNSDGPLSVEQQDFAGDEVVPVDESGLELEELPEE